MKKTIATITLGAMAVVGAATTAGAIEADSSTAPINGLDIAITTEPVIPGEFFSRGLHNNGLLGESGSDDRPDSPGQIERVWWVLTD
jgi:hypothetical protein